jgi:hypothetical protein
MKEIFYSNGIDIFGPVSLHEFSQNRYYKSTLIWFEGLSGWVNIAECDDLKHLIGTMPTPALDQAVPHSLPNLTPPLSKKESVKGRPANRQYFFIAAALIVVLLALVTYYFNTRLQPVSQQITGQPVAEIGQENTPTIDTNATREAERVKKAAAEAEKKTYRMNWEKFVVAATNDYKQKDIGGIDDLKVIIRNTSPYKIDQVVVKVLYVKANGSTYQTEMLTFDNVEANSNKELFAPKSDRGVKVNCSIQLLKSESMNICLDKRDKNFAARKGEDAFRCK